MKSTANVASQSTDFQYKRRVLYDKSSRTLPANYVDQSFLQGLQKNVNLKTYYLWDAVENTTEITQELNSVCGIFSVFVFLDNKWLPHGSLFITSSILVTWFYILFEANWTLSSLYEDVKRALVYLAFILGLCPILKTLTHTVSTDSIYFMSIILMIIHLVTYNYGLSVYIASSSLSLTAALAASITLASRLSTTFYVFEFLTFAVEVIALFPTVRRKIQTRWPKIRFTLTLLIGTVGAFAVASVSLSYAVILFILEIFINIFCPIVFVRWQKYKENIYGPWDEAIPSAPSSGKLR